MTSRTVQCPTCRKAGDWFTARWGPFCSERCRLIDLGRWLNEEHRILEPLQPDGVPVYDPGPGGQDAPEDLPNDLPDDFPGNSRTGLG